MRRQRPGPPGNAGAVACLALVAATVTGCGSGAVPVHAPDLSPEAAKACDRLVEALPERVAGQQRRTTEPGDAYGAAWGDPAIVLTCGVPRPPGFDRFSTCQVTNGVAWFIPERQITGRPIDLVLTTIGRSQNVQVRLPAEYWPPAAAMVDLAPTLKRTTRVVEDCG